MNPRSRVKRITDEISGVAAQYGVTSWELSFLRSVEVQTHLTAAQEKVIKQIEDKVFGEEDE